MRTMQGPVSLLGSVSAALAVLMFILVYGVYAPGSPEAPRPLTVVFCSPIDIAPGMSTVGAAMTFGGRDFPILPTHIAERFRAFARDIGVPPEAPLPFKLIEVCISKDRKSITGINILE